MGEQIEMFKIISPRVKQKLEWWDMHGFRPEVGMIIMIDTCPHWSLQADVLSVNEEDEEIVVQVRKYPDCPWIKPDVLTLGYWDVDPLLVPVKTEDPD